MATKKLSNAEIKKKKCTYPDPPDEGLPIWMGTFADMMTLLFAFFVLLFSMSTIDPVKWSAYQNSQADQVGGITQSQESGMPIKSQVEIKEDLQDINNEDLNEKIKEKMKEAIDLSDKNIDAKNRAKAKIDSMEEPINVSHDPRGVALEINGEICFGSGSIELEAGIKELLKEVADLMTNPDDNRGILVEGHTDNLALPEGLKEKYKNNRVLSAFRASEVVTYLSDSLNVPENRLVSVGYADQWPVDVTWSEMRSGDVVKKGLIEKYNSTTYKDDEQTEVEYTAAENQKRNRRIKIIFATK